MASNQATGGALSARAIALAEGVLRTMLVTKLKMAALGLLVLGVLGLGARTSGSRSGAATASA
jgi:hypothetical protein